MAAPATADAFLQALRAEGLTVVQHGDWRDHNRDHAGPWGPVHGVMIHHTVTRGHDHTVEICRRGYDGLPGPLCHGVICKQGHVHLIGYGRANHAGLGDDDVLRAVIDESGPPADNEANTDGNRHFYGFECENLGDGDDPWPVVQLDAIERAAAAVCRHHRWSERSVIGHLEWQPGKIDPRGFTMDSMRNRIRSRLAGAPGRPEEDDVPKYLSLGMTDPLTLQPGQWRTIAWNEEYSDQADDHFEGGQTFAHNAHYNGLLTLVGEGVARGDEIQVRIAEDEDGGGPTVRTFDPIEVVGTSGGTYGGVPVLGVVGAGTRAKIQLCHFGPTPVTITRAALRAHVWPL
ncbi:N-acetylmuramoyl-L-alanine amidase [Streptomyces sp. DH41]|nr:N-acetylmuramoyl-L-alanine amidase [Streptomyces sp. DH41]MDG9724621.1 N-acetylmuramoyl-L-alanine amidase [Streptomyces sp. DH41]